MHACGRAAAKESGRYALSKVQVQGASGRVVGTDGVAALLWAGFAFPFADDVLVPAVPVFGTKPLADEPGVTVGRTATHLVVGAGPWAVWLPADVRARYPDVAGVIPRSAPTTVALGNADAAELLKALPGLPGGRERRPVTLDAGAVVRVLGSAAGATRAVTLPGAARAGAAALVVLDRRILARALALGCRTLALTPDGPVVATGGAVTLVAAPLDPGLAAPDSPDELPKTPTEERPPMKPETTAAPDRDDPPDPLGLAEGLRAALAEAATRAARLVAALRHAKREKKALAAVLSGLKQLTRSGGGAR